VCSGRHPLELRFTLVRVAQVAKAAQDDPPSCSKGKPGTTKARTHSLALPIHFLPLSAFYRARRAMQGPRFSSHSNSEGVELPALVPPKAAAYDAPPFAEQEGAGEDKEEDKKKDKEGGGGQRTRREKMEHVLMIVKRHGQFVGPGLVASVAFIGELTPLGWASSKLMEGG
jgi:hypothetical protein